MSYGPNQMYPGATELDPNYPKDKFKDNNPSTTNNGTPLKAIKENQDLTLETAVMNDAGFDYSGVADTPQDSQLFKAYKASLGNGANLLSNHNFLIQTPDDSQPLPSATPTSYPPGYQIFSGVFANEATGITNLTYIDGRVSFSGGDLYFAVPNTGGVERLTSAQLTASVADFDGKPRTCGVSFALVGDEYRVTVGVDALEDVSAALTPLGSVKFEQGSVATGHEAESLSSRNLSDYTAITYRASGGKSAVENMVLNAKLGERCSTGGTLWDRTSNTNSSIDDFRPINDLYLEDWCLNTPTSSNDNTYGWVEINSYVKNDGAGDASSFPAINLGANNNFKISAGVQIPLGVYVLKSDGYSKLTPDVTLVSPFTIMDFNVGAHINISGVVFNQFDTGCTAIGGRTWRQSSIYDCQFIGGYGVDLSDNNWGTTIEKCRFTSVDGGVNASIGGQTFQVINCLFFNSKEYDLKSESVTIGSELIVSGCVFESGDGSAWPGKTAIIDGVKEVKFIGCQSERLKGIDGLSDTKLSYDMIFNDSTVEFDNCRFWGGIWNGLEGSASSGRAYGVYLDNSTLKLNNSRLYSFHKRALRCENGSTVSTDIESNLDFRSVGGEPIFISSTDLGENWITNGDFVYTYDNSIPISFDRFNNVGQVRDANVTESCNAARLDLTASNAPSYSNWIDVASGEWVSWRFIMEASGYVNYRIRNQDDVAIFEKTNLAMFAGEDNKALVCNSIQIPDGTTRIKVEYPNGSVVEGMALYRNIKLNITASGSLYSTNDSTNGCDVDMTCPLPFKKNTRDLISIQQGAGSLFTGPWSGGEKVFWDTPLSSADLGIVRIGGAWASINWS